MGSSENIEPSKLRKYLPDALSTLIPAGGAALFGKKFLDSLYEVASNVIQEGESLSWPGKGWELGRKIFEKIIIPSPKYGIIENSGDILTLVPELTEADKVIYQGLMSGGLATKTAAIVVFMGILGFAAYKTYKHYTSEKGGEQTI